MACRGFWRLWLVIRYYRLEARCCAPSFRVSSGSRFSRSSADDQTRLGSELSGLEWIGGRNLKGRIRDETERLAHGIGIGMGGFQGRVGIVRVYEHSTARDVIVKQHVHRVLLQD